MARQQAVRFPDELHAAIQAEAVARGRPHSFSSVLIEWATLGQAMEGGPIPPVPNAADVRSSLGGRGSPSPSLERFAGRGVAKATKGKQ